MPSTNEPPPAVTAQSLLQTAAPVADFYLTEILVGLTDLAVVGALGATELAAVGLGKTLLFSVMVTGFAVLSIGTVIMAERPTASRCGAVIQASIPVMALFVLFGVIVGSFAGALLERGGYAPDLVAAFEDYARVLAWALAPALFFAVLKNVLNALARTGAIIWVSVGIVAGNLVASVVLVHGAGAWDGLGVSGAAWATLGVNAMAAAVLFAIVVRGGHIRLRGVRRGVVLRRFSEILRLGWAAGAQQALESVLFVVVLYLLGLHSTLWLAAGTVVFAVMELNFAASGALGEVLATRIAAVRSLGPAAAERALRLGGGVAAAVAAALGVTVGIFAEATVAVFSSADTSGAARSLMVDLLRWTAPFFVFDALQIVFVHALRGMRRTILPMILSTGCYWLVGLGGGMLLSAAAGFGAAGIWAGFCLGLASAAVLLGAMALRYARFG